VTITPQEVKALLPHTWPLFFTRHGRFTSIQQVAIPPITAGQDILLIAPTATGKTEAVIAPLVERYWDGLRQPGLSLLYICPTRALVRDLYERLRSTLADAGIVVGMKTGDVGPVAAQRPPAILLITPESTDSLLTRAPRLFRQLQAIVLDEIHLFDNSPRGDHLRCLLGRIERIRNYERADAPPMQRVALSATVPNPAGVAERYLRQGQIVQAGGGRKIEAEIRPLYDLAELADALNQRAARKSLIFCNAREEAEQTAAYLRQHSRREAEIFVHYSNLDAAIRLEVEERFAAAAVAVCVATSTLELGVDIGSVDDVVLLGAPADPTSFLQRIGRGSRRQNEIRVLCLPKSPGEWARFAALLALANADSAPLDVENAAVYGFRPSVIVQQIFSLIKQSPTGGVRLADVRRLAPLELDSDALRQIVANLTFDDYLQKGRPGEWKPGEKLQELIDRHEIYSNIGADVGGMTAVDAYTGRIIAQTDRVYEPGTVVLFGGRPMKVVWRERYRFGLTAAPGQTTQEVLHFHKGSVAIPFVVAQAVARSLNVTRREMIVLPDDPGVWLFHFWGTAWGELLAAILRGNGIVAASVNEFCLHCRPALNQLPPWNDALAQKAAHNTAIVMSDRLEMGRYHSLLPAHIGLAAAVKQLNLPRFQAYYEMTQARPSGSIAKNLEALLDY